MVHFANGGNSGKVHTIGTQTTLSAANGDLVVIAQKPKKPEPLKEQTWKCPLCGDKVQLKRDGKGGKFWGCVRYDQGCKGTISMKGVPGPVKELKRRAANDLNLQV